MGLILKPLASFGFSLLMQVKTRKKRLFLARMIFGNAIVV
jgi:hypothetical protein